MPAQLDLLADVEREEEEDGEGDEEDECVEGDGYAVGDWEGGAGLC